MAGEGSTDPWDVVETGRQNRGSGGNADLPVFPGVNPNRIAPAAVKAVRSNRVGPDPEGPLSPNYDADGILQPDDLNGGTPQPFPGTTSRPAQPGGATRPAGGDWRTQQAEPYLQDYQTRVQQQADGGSGNAQTTATKLLSDARSSLATSSSTGAVPIMLESAAAGATVRVIQGKLDAKIAAKPGELNAFEQFYMQHVSPTRGVIDAATKERALITERLKPAEEAYKTAQQLRDQHPLVQAQAIINQTDKAVSDLMVEVGEDIEVNQERLKKATDPGEIERLTKERDVLRAKRRVLTGGESVTTTEVEALVNANTFSSAEGEVLKKNIVAKETEAALKADAAQLASLERLEREVSIQGANVSQLRTALTRRNSEIAAMEQGAATRTSFLSRVNPWGRSSYISELDNAAAAHAAEGGSVVAASSTLRRTAWDAIKEGGSKGTYVAGVYLATSALADGLMGNNQHLQSNAGFYGTLASAGVMTSERLGLRTKIPLVAGIMGTSYMFDQAPGQESWLFKPSPYESVAATVGVLAPRTGTGKIVTTLGAIAVSKAWRAVEHVAGWDRSEQDKFDDLMKSTAADITQLSGDSVKHAVQGIVDFGSRDLGGMIENHSNRYDAMMGVDHASSVQGEAALRAYQRDKNSPEAAANALAAAVQMGVTNEAAAQLILQKGTRLPTRNQSLPEVILAGEKYDLTGTKEVMVDGKLTRMPIDARSKLEKSIQAYAVAENIMMAHQGQTIGGVAVTAESIKAIADAKANAQAQLDALVSQSHDMAKLLKEVKDSYRAHSYEMTDLMLMLEGQEPNPTGGGELNQLTKLGVKRAWGYNQLELYRDMSIQDIQRREALDETRIAELRRQDPNKLQIHAKSCRDLALMYMSRMSHNIDNNNASNADGEAVRAAIYLQWAAQLEGKNQNAQGDLAQMQNLYTQLCSKMPTARAKQFSNGGANPFGVSHPGN